MASTDRTPVAGVDNLSVTLASGDVLHVREFNVHERMSTLFTISLTLASEDPDIDFEPSVGREATFVMHGGAAAEARPRVWKGICSQLHQVSVEEAGMSIYHAEIVPRLWLATQRRNHRMFQLVSEIDIVRKLLGEWGIEPILRLTATYKKRKYRVQYGESDYAFVCRMLEDAGVSFFFEQQGDDVKLVLSDAPQRAELRPSKLPFRDQPMTARDHEHVTAVSIGRRVRPGRYTLRDHDYRRPPSYKLIASAVKPGPEERYERFHYEPGASLFESDKLETTPHADDKGRYRIDEADAATLAERRLDAKRGDAIAITFETNAIDVAPGVVVSFLEHPRRDLGDDRRLLVVEATHAGTFEGGWSHRCEARSAATPYRPPLVTPKPKVNGVESATVVGPAGEEIHTDEFGRVRCHFHWDRESKLDDNSSCWIHVSQPWGGAGYGGTNLPRIGQEVLVDFLGGDPDRPVIVGRVYTNLQKVPYGLPANKTQSGWKSNSTHRTGGYNELMFEDAAGKELLRMQAEKDHHKLVKHDEQATIGHDRVTLVRNNDDHTVGANLTKRVVDDEREETGQNRTVTVGINRTTRVGQIDSTTAGEKHYVTVGSSSATMVDGKIVFTTGKGATITMEGDEIRLEAATIKAHASLVAEVLGDGLAVLASPGGTTLVEAASGVVVATKGGDVLIHGGPMVKINP